MHSIKVCGVQVQTASGPVLKTEQKAGVKGMDIKGQVTQRAAGTSKLITWFEFKPHIPLLTSPGGQDDLSPIYKVIRMSSVPWNSMHLKTFRLKSCLVEYHCFCNTTGEHSRTEFGQMVLFPWMGRVGEQLNALLHAGPKCCRSTALPPG